jgi:hypothetical protein
MILKSDVYLAIMFGFSFGFYILLISHTINISLLCESLPEVAKYLPSCEKAKHFNEFTGTTIIDISLPLA